MEIIIPREHGQFHGYYHIPENDYVIVSPDGNFINLRTLNKVTPGILPSGYWKISINTPEKTVNFYVHRLLSRTFIGRPKRHLDKSYNVLEVNHIDGDKSNNSLLNLEWITPTENSRHALVNFLKNYNCVFAKHILNGKVIKFPSVMECAKEFEIDYRRLSRHLKSKDAGSLTKKWFVFKLDDGSDWPSLLNDSIEENQWDILYGVWYARNKLTNLIVLHNTLEELCSMLNLIYHNVQQHVVKYRESKPYGEWFFTYDDKPIRDAVVNLPTRKKHGGKQNPVPVKITKNNGEVFKFTSIRQAGKHLNIDEKVVKYAITRRNGKIGEHLVELIC